MRYLLIAALIVLAAGMARAEPRVVVLPFDAMVDSVYIFMGEKQSVIDYRSSLQQMITSELLKYTEIWVVEYADLIEYIKTKNIKPDLWNDPKLASRIAADLEADYAIIGTYGEFTREIRVDGRVVVAASGDVPQGNTVTSVVGIWDDLPTAAIQVANQIVPIVTASGRLRPTSKGVLFPEGDLSAYDPVRTSPESSARLVVWVNAPAPIISTSTSDSFKRCDRIDVMNIPAEKMRTQSCKVAVIKAGKIDLRIEHRGYLPYVETLDLAAGKAYRLEVDLKKVETLPR
ncbi:hypothetical protein EHM69_01795 [candidate division KSB1 bacterium]|nr:MAG: hypothetical protein EHM69_01795 [candidate division KSB1 bacterium]